LRGGRLLPLEVERATPGTIGAVTDVNS